MHPACISGWLYLALASAPVIAWSQEAAPAPTPTPAPAAAPAPKSTIEDAIQDAGETPPSRSALRRNSPPSWMRRAGCWWIAGRSPCDN